MKNQSYLQMVFSQFKKSKLALVFSLLFTIIVIFSIFYPIVSGIDPNAITYEFSANVSFDHLLGTDQIGRDVLTRICIGVQVSLVVGLVSTLISTIIGVIFGLIAGYFGGFIDSLIMRITDMVMSFPYILLILVAASVFEPGLFTIVLILGFVNWPGMVRLVRGNVLSLRESEFIKGCIVTGLPTMKILFSEILPNTLGSILVYATNVLALSILDEAALSFLGLGIQQPTASLGNLLNSANSITVLTQKLWMWLPAGIILVLIVISINFIGDALRDAIDPNSKQ